jgi:uncharacterized protein (TIGR01777 family)
MKNLNILIIGGTGFIGTTLSRALIDAGHTVAVISRGPSLNLSLGHVIRSFQADVTIPGQWQELIPDFDALINLAGVSIFRRWTARGKQEILNSRIIAANNVINALRMRRGKTQQLLSVSGVGYYGFHGDEILDEENPPGSDFLARVAAQWESKIEEVKELGIRPVTFRLGHVFGNFGGVLPKLVTLARLHLASHWGSGEQWISWIHEDDLARCVIFLLEKHIIHSPVNITSPNPMRNREMMKLLAELTGKRVFIPPVPEFMLRMITGEFASVFVNGQRVIPRKLIQQGFNFNYPDLKRALKMLMGYRDPV